MQQRGAVNELDRRRQFAGAIAAAAQEPRRGQSDERTNAFAASVDLMLRKVRDRADGA